MADHLGHRDRMRSRLLSGGEFADHELLEMLLYYALPRVNTNTIAHELLDRFGSVEGVLSASKEELSAVSGIGDRCAELLMLTGMLHRRAKASPRKKKAVCIMNSQDAVSYVFDLYRGVKNEVLYLVSLDAKYCVIGSDIVSEGTIDEAAVYPRRILWAALSRNAHAVILAHNHPGGSPSPSTADIKMTLSISSVFDSVGIRFADHIICSEEGCYCFSSKRIYDGIDDSQLEIAQYAAPRREKQR